MKLVWLAWYVSVVLLLLATLSSLVTYGPDIEFLGVLLPTAFGCGAILAGVLAAGLRRLPPHHRIHRSLPVWATGFAVAVLVTLMLVLVG